MHDWKETLEWYTNHQTTKQIGFNPDGMCLKVCRTARELDSMYPSAKASQDATPEEYRVHKVKDLRKGMVGYFDDPNDSNVFGHIATMVGRTKDFNWDDLHDTLWVTNSVVGGELVVVRGDYFEAHWGDKFQFGSTWLNGAVLDVFSTRTLIQRFRRDSKNGYDLNYLDRAITEGKRRDIKPVVDEIERYIAMINEPNRRPRIQRFIDLFERHRIIKISLLNKAVAAYPEDRHIQAVRNGVVRAIKSLPER